MKVIMSVSFAFTIAVFSLMCSYSGSSGEISSSVNGDSSLYNIYKIDSVNNYYLIYAKKAGKLFKIISKKTEDKRKEIAVGKGYKLKLYSILAVNGQPVIPQNQMYELSGWKIDDATTIRFEGDSIRDLFYASNLRGLVLIPR